MQCPNCQHQADASAFGEPAKCPACGVYYEKALAHQRRMEAATKAPEPEQQAKPKPALVEPVLAGVKGAAEAVREGRAARAALEHAERARLLQAQPVVVIDIRMRFWSMVWFMVKWVIASIPALIILCVIAVVSFSFLMGLFSSPGLPPRL